jgi:hypothetical protein
MYRAFLKADQRFSSFSLPGGNPWPGGGANALFGLATSLGFAMLCKTFNLVQKDGFLLAGLAITKHHNGLDATGALAPSCGAADAAFPSRTVMRSFRLL